MDKSPETRASLLIRIRDTSDQVAWSEFVEIYIPLIYAYGCHHGLQAADASDLAQEVLESVSAAISRFDYDPRRGSFRGWLFTITRNKLRDFIARNNRQARGSGDTVIKELLDEQPDRESDEQYWNRQHQWRLFSWVAERVRVDFKESTWTAFWATAVENKPVARVAKEQEISVGAVYIAKSRVMARIREEIDTIEEE